MSDRVKKTPASSMEHFAAQLKEGFTCLLKWVTSQEEASDTPPDMTPQKILSRYSDSEEVRTLAKEAFCSTKYSQTTGDFNFPALEFYAELQDQCKEAIILSEPSRARAKVERTIKELERVTTWHTARVSNNQKKSEQSAEITRRIMDSYGKIKTDNAAQLNQRQMALEIQKHLSRTGHPIQLRRIQERLKKIGYGTVSNIPNEKPVGASGLYLEAKNALDERVGLRRTRKPKDWDALSGEPR